MAIRHFVLDADGVDAGDFVEGWDLAGILRVYSE